MQSNFTTEDDHPYTNTGLPGTPTRPNRSTLLIAAAVVLLTTITIVGSGWMFFTRTTEPTLLDPTVTTTETETVTTNTTTTDTVTVTELPGDPMQLINTGLTNYQTALTEAGGVNMNLVTADSQTVELALSPTGEYRAITGVPTAPEWVFAGGRMYARLGEKELTAQQAGLAKIGKPDATWTDAAIGSEQQTLFLAAGNLVNAVADLVPAMSDPIIGEGDTPGSRVIQGNLSITALGQNAERYGLSTTPTTLPGTTTGTVTETTTGTATGTTTDMPATTPTLAPTVETPSTTTTPQATVAFIINAEGVLTGYLVTPAGAGQPVSAVITNFAPVEITAPDTNIVVTLADIAMATGGTAGTATATTPAVTTDPALTGTATGEVTGTATGVGTPSMPGTTGVTGTPTLTTPTP